MTDGVDKRSPESAPEPQVQQPAARDMKCSACRLWRLVQETAPEEPATYVLGALWAFLLPCLGLLVGSGLAVKLAGNWQAQVLAATGGLAVGVAVGVLGRRLTLPRQQNDQ